MQERRNSIANALELRLSCTNPSMLSLHYFVSWTCFDLSIRFWGNSRRALCKAAVSTVARTDTEDTPVFHKAIDGNQISLAWAGSIPWGLYGHSAQHGSLNSAVIGINLEVRIFFEEIINIAYFISFTSTWIVIFPVLVIYIKLQNTRWTIFSQYILSYVNSNYLM